MQINIYFERLPLSGTYSTKTLLSQFKQQMFILFRTFAAYFFIYFENFAKES